MSRIRVEAIETLTGVEVHTAKAWLNFAANDSQMRIRDSANIASMTDNGLGDHTKHLINPMRNGGYVPNLQTSRPTADAITPHIGRAGNEVHCVQTDRCRDTYTDHTGPAEPGICAFTIHGKLA